MINQPELWKYTVHIEWSDIDDGYIATVPEMPGCSAFGHFRIDSIKELDDAMVAWLESKEKSMKREKIEKQLKEGIVEVVFKKKNGTRRTMICTLMEEHIPPVFLNGDEQMQQKTRTVNPDVLAVVDLEAKAWRSFRLDSVIEIQRKAS